LKYRENFRRYIFGNSRMIDIYFTCSGVIFALIGTILFYTKDQKGIWYWMMAATFFAIENKFAHQYFIDILISSLTISSILFLEHRKNE
jgi:hypothetical protein